jgi:hypothetical protein
VLLCKSCGSYTYSNKAEKNDETKMLSEKSRALRNLSKSQYVSGGRDGISSRDSLAGPIGVVGP